LHFTGHELNQLLSVYGYWVVVGIESIGMPMPGETMLIAASIYAGTTHDLDIALVIAAASCGAVLKMAILGEAFARAGSYQASTSAALLESGRLP
jgi:membrane protein DedA with SNARE-associated domain